MEIEKKMEEQSLEDRKKNQEVRKKLYEERRKEQKKISLLEYKVQLNEEVLYFILDIDSHSFLLIVSENGLTY